MRGREGYVADGGTGGGSGTSTAREGNPGSNRNEPLAAAASGVRLCSNDPDESIEERGFCVEHVPHFISRIRR